MKKSEIVVGGKYVAKVSNKLTTVRVDDIREVSKFRRSSYSGKSEYGQATVYDVTNLTTGRKTTFRSAAKFRRVAPGYKTDGSKELRASGAIARGEKFEGGSVMTKTSSETPMMKRYRELKKETPDSLLLFRMGDFYELFYEDAETAAKVLGLTLTGRDKASDNPIPMAGFPYHALEGYLNKLIRAGQRVAICDQVANDTKYAGKVTHLVTENNESPGFEM